MAQAMKVHKVKKGDTLEAIAKKFKVKKWEVIWNCPENAKLKSKRKLPRQITVGDAVVIPFNDKERAALYLEIAFYRASKRNDLQIEFALLGQAAELDKAAELFDRRMKETDAFYRRLMAADRANLKNIKRVGMTVDIAASVLIMSRRMANLAKGYKGANPKELAKINKDAAKLAADISLDGVNMISSEAKKTIGKYLNKHLPKSLNTAIGGLKVIENSYDKIQSPSFWATTVASLIEGKSWSAAVTRDLEEESNQRIARIDVQRIKALGALSASKREFMDDAAARRKEAKNAARRIGDADKALKSLPAL
jgi:hypothetical protein